MTSLGTYHIIIDEWPTNEPLQSKRIMVGKAFLVFARANLPFMTAMWRDNSNR